MSSNFSEMAQGNSKSASNDPELEIPGDPPVYYTQVWLNQTYGNNPNWATLSEDGITGWGTIYGLVRALQIYLGVNADGDFGNGTRTAFQTRFSGTNGCVVPTLNATDNIYGIISGALWCKGYYGSFSQQIDCKIDERGSSGIINLKRDAGLSTSNNHVDALLMKALLSMDQFVLLSDYGGTAEIRSIQQYLNANYIDYVGIVPCDGLYQREMNRALIKVLQYIEGSRGSNVDGIFGNGTKAALPQLSENNQPAEAMRLYHFCLTCNGYPISGTSWTADTTLKTRAFQTKCYIPVTGLGDTNTWMSLLLSKGNSDRNALGCDCATVLDASKAAALYGAGYRYVGRYLSGTVGSGSSATSKALTKAEMTAIFASGLSLFAIYQEGSVSLQRYTYAAGVQDATNALNAANGLDIPIREYIYFAVDYDIMDGNIASSVVPYFEGINEVIAAAGNKYLVGIYGSRNVCSRICSEFGLASSCFISDMSTGYSGNMGYPMPENWAFDQFHEYTFSGNGVSFPLDKDAVSGQYLGFNHFSQESSETITVTDEEKKTAAYNLISPIVAPSILGTRESFSWELGPFIIHAEPATIAVTYKCNSLFNLNDDCAQYVTYGITNGTIPSAAWSNTSSLFNSLDDSFKTTLNMTDFSLASELIHDIGYGKISFGLKLSLTGQLTTYFVIEQYLGGDELVENTVSVKYEFTMNNSNGNNNDGIKESFAECISEAVTVVAIATVTAAAVVCIGEYVIAAGIAGEIAKFFAMLGSWLSALYVAA